MIATQEELRDQALRVEEALRQVLERQEAWHCNRVWEAWAVDTMSRDDFSLVTEDPVAVEELVQAAMSALGVDGVEHNAATPKIVYCPIHGDLLAATRSYRCENAPKGHEHMFSRAAVPDAATAAIERVRALHRRSFAVSAQGGLRFDDPCAECDGKAGVHACGCWADVDAEFVCSECFTGIKFESVKWPCPTIAALDGAPEPVRAGKEYRRVKPDGFPVYHATFESMPSLDEGWSAEYRSFTAWLPAEGESK